MKLFIIEGKGKIESIKKYLGGDYQVFATAGHVRDLPTKNLGVQITNNFEPVYEIMPDKKNIVNDLVKLAKKAETIYIATDPDREGEAIAYHISYILNINPNEKVRVAFNSIDKETINKALQEPRNIDLDLVNAQQARRVLDRLVGYKISPIICKKIKPNLSAGRVQSAALKMIVEREKEIQNFKPEEYWNLNVELEKNGAKPNFKALLNTKNNEKIKINNNDEMQEVLKELDNKDFVVTNVKKSVTKSKPKPPFTTSTMQQDAANKLNFTLKKTTQVAQNLYEGIEVKGEGKVALVTYIRTDSTRVSEGAMIKAKEYIVKNFGEDYAPKKFNIYKSKDAAQDAHEAIRPIDLNRTPDSLKDKIDNDLYKLYKLIYNRFLASQMTEAQYNSVSVDISCDNYGFKVSGKTPKFLGYTTVYVDTTKENEVKLPVLENGDKLKSTNFLPEQKFTKPEPRYTEATIVDAMEAKGIGRPATYAATINVLLSRYCTKDGKSIVPTETAFQVMEFLDKNFAKTININFTAQMETALDEIAEGKREWHALINGFYNKFIPQLKNAGASVVEAKVTDVICDKCGANMVEREGKFGKFLACPNFPKCKNIKNIEKEKPVEVITDIVCEKCGCKMIEKQGKFGKFLGCSNYPTCNNIQKVLPKNIDPNKVVVCDKCGANMILKQGKYGYFYACPNYPTCQNIVKITKEKNSES
ncbi:MAG: type I DNA topoisomerase [Clostridiales bacterium]|nr:type I DNA topoisomerase [Clostridiales bacterium]